VDALKKNRACQKLIRRKMVNIEAKIEENKDLRDRVKCLLGYQLSCRKSVSKFLCQKEDPRVRLISSRKPTAQGAKVKCVCGRYVLSSVTYSIYRSCSMASFVL
jgi:transcription factor MYB, plant